MGVSHAHNLSLSLPDLSKVCACVPNTFKAASGELQLSKAAAVGCVDKSCPVSLVNSSEAASNIAVKLEAERLVA